MNLTNATYTPRRTESAALAQRELSGPVPAIVQAHTLPPRSTGLRTCYLSTAGRVHTLPDSMPVAMRDATLADSVRVRVCHARAQRAGLR